MDYDARQDLIRRVEKAKKSMISGHALRKKEQNRIGIKITAATAELMVTNGTDKPLDLTDCCFDGMRVVMDENIHKDHKYPFELFMRKEDDAFYLGKWYPRPKGDE